MKKTEERIKGYEYTISRLHTLIPIYNKTLQEEETRARNKRATKKGNKRKKKATNKDTDRVEGRETALKERRHCTGSALTRSHLSGNLLK